MPRFAEEILLLILDSDNGDVVASMPPQSLHTLLAGAVLMDLALENRIDTDLEQVSLVDETPVGDDLLDPVLADIAAANEPRPIDYWLERTAMRGEAIREEALASLVEQGIVQSDESFLFFLTSRVQRSRKYPVIDGTATEEAQFRIMRLLFSDEIPEPRDIVLVSLAAAGDVFKHLLSPEELAEAQERIDLISRMDLIGQSVARALRAAEPLPVPSVRPAAEIPQAAGWPLIGNAIAMAGDIRAFLTREYRKHGPIFRLRALHHSFIAMVGPEANVFLGRISGTHLRSYEPYREFAVAMGGHRVMLNMDGSEHLRMRKVQVKGYSPRTFEANLDLAQDATLRAIAEWPDGQPIGVQRAMQEIIAEQIGLCCTGVSPRAYIGDIAHFLETVISVHIIRRSPKWVKILPKFRRSERRMRELYEQILEAHQPKKRDGAPPDFVDDLLEVNRTDPQFLPETDLPANILAPYQVGLDTSASVCAFMLYVLLTRPDLWEQMQAEVDAMYEQGPADSGSIEEAGRNPPDRARNLAYLSDHSGIAAYRIQLIRLYGIPDSCRRASLDGHDGWASSGGVLPGSRSIRHRALFAGPGAAPTARRVRPVRGGPAPLPGQQFLGSADSAHYGDDCPRDRTCAGAAGTTTAIKLTPAPHPDDSLRFRLVRRRGR